MKLVETVRRYNTLELLEGMVDISADHFRDHMYHHVSPFEKATIFSFGRQCGHTEAIKEYVSKSVLESDDDVLIVCHNQHTAREMNKRLGFDAALSVAVVNNIKNFDKFRGCSPKSVKIIFDTCTMGQIKAFISEALQYNAYDIKAITIVAPL